LNNIINNINTTEVSINWDPGTPCLQTLQPLAFRRVFNNLLLNAIRYGAGKPVYITCKCNKEEVSIQIMDSGPGIPTDKVEAVFRPFYRLETSRGSGTGGSGLGLAIVKQLADANGWKVQLLARPEGGTNALLRL